MAVGYCFDFKYKNASTGMRGVPFWGLRTSVSLRQKITKDNTENDYVKCNEKIEKIRSIHVGDV